MNIRLPSLIILAIVAGFGLSGCGDSDDVDEVEVEDGEVEVDD